MRQVQLTAELRRIAAIPRRTLEPDSEAAGALTRLLRRPGSDATLRPIQAHALLEAVEGGLFAPMQVGSGKTLVTLLAPTVLAAKRPMLFVPAALKEKTERDRLALSRDWLVHSTIQVESYELLGRPQASTMLAGRQPDVIVLDECHRVKNRRAACTKRLTRYLQGSRTRMVALSGTITKRSLLDYGHILQWCLPDTCPIPRGYGELEDWASALDEHTSDRTERIGVGALITLGQCSSVDSARRVFSDRMTQSPGVVSSPLDERLACSLLVRMRPFRPSQDVEDAMAALRQSWELPDGQQCVEALELYRHMRELALGFWYRWDPPPPVEWLGPRKRWRSACRKMLSASRTYDSPAHLANGIDAGDIDATFAGFDVGLPDSAPVLASTLLRDWRDVRDTFEPHTVPVWIDPEPLFALVSGWLAEGPGLIWTEHETIGQTLSKKFDLPFFSRKGLNFEGKYVMDLPHGTSGILSIHACREGINMQPWNRSLVVSPPVTGLVWEQMLGRTHRPGQLADEVTCDVAIGCEAHRDAFAQARRDANYIEKTTGVPQKLGYCDVV